MAPASPLRRRCQARDGAHPQKRDARRSSHESSARQSAALAHSCVGAVVAVSGARRRRLCSWRRERDHTHSVQLNNDASETRESGASGPPACRCLSSPPQRTPPPPRLDSESECRTLVRVSQFPRHQPHLGLGSVRFGKTPKYWIPDGRCPPHLDCLSSPLHLFLIACPPARRSTSRGAHRARSHARRWRWRVRREVF